MQESNAGGWRRVLVVGAACATVLVGLTAVPASGAPTGSGSAAVQPTTVIAPVPTSIVVAYTASAPMTNGVVSVTVPAGWTQPTTSNSSASTGVVAVVGSTITVTGVTLTAGPSMTITYGTPTSKVVPPTTGGYGTFTVAMSPTSSGTVTPIASSPVTFVYAQAPKALFDQVTGVPLAVFNKVGIGSPAIPINPPTIVHKQRPFVTKLHGATVPRSFFYGAEYCPFCGPASWGIVVALSRFGHFNRLYEMESSLTDYAPDTPGFTFHFSTYTSPFLTFNGFEVEDPFLAPLTRLPRGIEALVNKYDAGQSFPFMDVGNVAFVTESPFDPTVLASQSQATIAAHLTTASNGVTRAIVSWANYFSAGICATDHERPGPVCKSAGVLRADLALKLPRP